MCGACVHQVNSARVYRVRYGETFAFAARQRVGQCERMERARQLQGGRPSCATMGANVLIRLYYLVCILHERARTFITVRPSCPLGGDAASDLQLWKVQILERLVRCAFC